MKLVQVDIQAHKKTDRLIRTFELSPHQVISAKQSRNMVRVVITKALFIEHQYLIEQMDGRVRAEVFWVDTENMDRRYTRDLRSGAGDQNKIAANYIKRVRKIPRADYKSLSPKGSPGGKFSVWQDVLYAIYHIDRVDENGDEVDD